MYYVLIAIHVVVCIFLIAVILLQAGRGGGLNEAFGGATESILGTQAPNMLKKATEIGAILFMVISLLLAIMTARSGKSLFQQMGVPVLPQMPVSAPAAAGSQPAQSSSAGQTQAAPVQQAVQQVPAPVQAPVKAAQQAQAPVENK